MSEELNFVDIMVVKPGFRYEEEVFEITGDTWEGVLQEVESLLDAQYLDHGGLEGISLSLEFKRIPFKDFMEMHEEE